MNTALFRYLICGMVALGLGSATIAQGELSPFFLPRSMQTMQLNPAATDGGTVSVALPSVSVLASHSGFGFGDLVQQTPGQDSTFLAVGTLLPQLGDRNRLQTEIRADLLNVAIGIRKFRLLVGVNSRARMDLTYPKDLVRLAWNGNGAYLGEELQIGPGLSAMAWNEVYAGGQIGIGDRTRVGGRLKYLSGVGYAGTTQNDLSWITNAETYAWSLNLDYQLQTAGLDLGHINGQEFAFDPQGAPAIFQQNHGFALDLGVIIQPIEQLELGLAATDLGQISWTGTARRYDVSGNFEFDGLDLSPLWSGDSLNVESLPDSLLQQISFAETEEVFSTALPGRYNISAAFEPVRWLRISSIFQAERYQGDWHPAFALGAQARAGKWLDAGVSWMARDGQLDIIGLQTSVRMGPVVTYFMADNILAPFRTRQAQMGHVRLGMNLQFGYRKK